MMKIVKFIEEVRQELVKVTWMPPKEVLFASGMVILVVFVFSLLFVFVDLAIFNVIKLILNIGA